jgi:hypothetical protein
MNRNGPLVTTPRGAESMICTFQCGPIVAMTQMRRAFAASSTPSASGLITGMGARGTSQTSASAATSTDVCKATMAAKCGSLTWVTPRARRARWRRFEMRSSNRRKPAQQQHQHGERQAGRKQVGAQFHCSTHSSAVRPGPNAPSRL